MGPRLLLFAGLKGYAGLAKVLRGSIGGNTKGPRGTESDSCEGRGSVGLALQKVAVRTFALRRLVPLSSSKLVRAASRPLLEAFNLSLLQRTAQ